MNRVADGLRQTSKGQLCYNREIEGKALTDLLHKCTSTPALSSPHSEISHQPLGCNMSFSPSRVEDGKQGRAVGFDLQELSQNSNDHGCEEKGHRDSFEKELPSAVNHSDMSVLDSYRSPQVRDDSPQSPGLDSVKSPVSCPQEATSWAAQIINGTEGSDTSRKQSEDTEDKAMDPIQKQLTVSFTEKLRIVHDVETGWDNRLKDLTEKKQQQFLEHQMRLGMQQEELMSVVEQRQRHDLEQQRNIVEKKHLSRKQEIGQAVQKVKESHDQCSRRQDARLKDLDLLSQQLKEAKAKREQVLAQQLNELRAMVQSIMATKASLVATLDNCPHKQHLLEAADKTRMLVRKLSEQAEAMLCSVDRNRPLDEVMSKLKQFKEQSQNALDFVNSLTAEAERKAKAAAEEAERQRQQSQSAQQAQSGQGQSVDQSGQAVDQSGQAVDQSTQPVDQSTQPVNQSGQAGASVQSTASGEVGALAAAAKEYEDNIKLLSQNDATLQPFVANQQMKKTRFDLQRAVNTPVNAISPVNSAHLRDKLLRLHALLRGERVEVQGKQVMAQSVPQGITFCKNLVAKMIARKADEQVSSSHESAFAIAAVAVGLWLEYPDVGELLMAHLQALCPYILPFYPPRLPNQSSTDYHRTLGYKVEDDGTIEQQDKFLRRMSGVIRFYAAILITSPPQGAHHPHPHGLEHAWIWLSRSLNLQPNPDITATAIYDMLQVTGHFLLKAYRVQFVKLLYFLFKVFLPKLKEVAAGSGPVSRLETFLETTMKNNAFIPQPEGYLPPQFF